jgi:hypothetical protein
VDVFDDSLDFFQGDCASARDAPLTDEPRIRARIKFGAGSSPAAGEGPACEVLVNGERKRT